MISVMTGEALGQRIRAARQQKRWSQRRLASEVGVSLWTIGRWERGDTRPHYEGDIDALEAALGVSLTGGGESEEEYTDPTEQALWALEHLPEPLRREFIARSRAYPAPLSA